MPRRGTVAGQVRQNAPTPPTSQTDEPDIAYGPVPVDVIQCEMRVRSFVEEVWNKRNYEPATDLYSDAYVNGFGVGPAAKGLNPSAATTTRSQIFPLRSTR